MVDIRSFTLQWEMIFLSIKRQIYMYLDHLKLPYQNFKEDIHHNCLKKKWN